MWANLIGIVLAALALGYWLGGRLADRRPEPRLLGRIVLAAAVFVAAIPFAAKPFLDFTVEGLDTASAGAVVGSFLAVLLLCAPPVVLLGMVSPFAIRLAVSSIATAGAVAGRLYALSTAGSLLGTFLPALVLIPAIGTQRTFLVVAAVLAGSSCFLLGAPYLVVTALLATLLLVPPGAIKGEDGLIHEETSPYQYIAVVQRPDGARVLRLNEGVAIHSLFWADSVLTGGEWDTYLAIPPLLGRPLERVAILGNAAGTTARALGVYYPAAEIDGVELDPAVSRVDALLRDGGEPTAHGARRRRPPVPPLDRRALRPDRGRRIPSAVRAVLPGNARVLPSRPGAPDAGWDRRVERRCRAGRQAARTRSRRDARGDFPQVLEWPALRFNTIVLGLTAPLSRPECSAAWRAGRAAWRRSASSSRAMPSGRAVRARPQRTIGRRRVGD